MSMFCRQCEQTAGGKGCTIKGVCGKDEKTALLQDLLLHGLKSIGVYGKALAEKGIRDKAAEKFVIEGLFTTITNVNFDPSRIEKLVFKAYETKERLVRTAAENKIRAGNETMASVMDWVPADSTGGMLEQGRRYEVSRYPAPNEAVRSLREILIYGLKGMAAYADHAGILGKEDKDVSLFFYTALAATVDDTLPPDALVSLIMEFGQVNLKCLEMLDRAHHEKFGVPQPTNVYLGVKKGPAIIVSGHDLLDLEMLLKQTENTGVNIYTHSEMLPAHGYPELKKYKHFAGHFGTAWQNQQKEFDNIPAVVLMTTNCIQEPRISYKDRIFTTGLVAWPGVNHIDADSLGHKEFSEVIKKAKSLGGFTEDKKEKDILVGFAHEAVLSVAGKVIDAVKSGKVKRFFLIGGCDGAKPGRNYYTEFAEKAPKDTIILTLACGKFRFNRLDLGYIGDLPRLLDCGQCNDSYSAIKIAVELAKAFKCSVNELPLSFILSWYEQKAVCILLTLFSLGIKGIRLGPSLPAFVTPDVLKVLIENFGIKPITNVEDDLRAALSGN